jgi:hypothetical protein
MLNFILLIVVLTFVASEKAIACSCARLSPCQTFNYADIVFVGKAVGSKEKIVQEGYDREKET